MFFFQLSFLFRFANLLHLNSKVELIPVVCGRGLFIHMGKILPDLLRSTVDAALRDDRTKLPPPSSPKGL